MKTVKGDLIKLALEGHFDVICHGCNCFCKMGKGIASQIKQVFPEAYEADKETQLGAMTKLGTFSHVLTRRGCNSYLFVVNAYTQYRYNPRYGMSKRMVDYEAVRDVFAKIKDEFHGLRIGYPKIGAGLAKGDWNIISEIIDEELEGEDHTLVVLD